MNQRTLRAAAGNPGESVSDGEPIRPNETGFAALGPGRPARHSRFKDNNEEAVTTVTICGGRSRFFSFLRAGACEIIAPRSDNL